MEQATDTPNKMDEFQKYHALCHTKEASHNGVCTMTPFTRNSRKEMRPVAVLSQGWKGNAKKEVQENLGADRKFWNLIMVLVM